MALALFRRDPADLSRRTGWYAFVRLFFLIVIALPGLLSLYVFEGWSAEVLFDIILFMTALASNALFYALVIVNRNDSYQRFLAAIWIGLDITLITFLIYANGGIESRIVILYAVPIIMAAAIFGRRATYIAAATSSLSYIVLVLGDYFGIITSVGSLYPDLHTDTAYVINTICFFPSVLLVIALGIDFLTRLLVAKERETTESLAALRRAQEIAKIGSWEWDLKNNTITWSDELTSILKAQHVQQPLTFDEYVQFVHPDDRRTHLKAISARLRTKNPFTSDYRIVMPNGIVKYIHGEGQMLTDHTGAVTKVIGTAQDVTEKHHLDNAKNDFVSLASHQLRTPASGVKAYLALLHDGYAGKLTRMQQNFLKKAYAANERQLDIIDSILSLASIESGKLVLHKTPVELNAIIRTCLSHHRPEARSKKQKLTMKFTRKATVVQADSNYLQMAIDNIISNAVKYTPEGGKINVITRTTPMAVYLEVSDSGIGIAKANLPLLFQKFSRLSDHASNTVDGSGLGLYLAKYIVTKHRGSISVRSQHGQGAQFRIRLPLAHAKHLKE